MKSAAKSKGKRPTREKRVIRYVEIIKGHCIALCNKQREERRVRGPKGTKEHKKTYLAGVRRSFHNGEFNFADQAGTFSAQGDHYRGSFMIQVSQLNRGKRRREGICQRGPLWVELHLREKKNQINRKGE